MKYLNYLLVCGFCTLNLATSAIAQDAPDCLPAETQLPDDEFAYLSTVAKVQREKAQGFLDQSDFKAAGICASQAAETSQELVELANLELINGLAFQGDIQRQAGNLPEAGRLLENAAQLLEITLLANDSEASIIALANVAPAFGEYLRDSKSPKAKTAYERIVLWAECGQMYADDVHTYTQILASLGGDPDAKVTDEMCQEPINFIAFR
jgi:tetratricopeptide (TPR) repeat protein